jgi:CHAT domain-containing protein
MNDRSLFSIIIFCLLCCNNAVAQVDSSYLIYKKQFTDLTVTRSGTLSEAGKALENFNKNQVTSNESFAAFIKKIYSEKKGIAVLLYFFHNDTLKRILFEPGRIVDEASIPIKKEALLSLTDDLNSALNVYEAAANRSPVQRGFSIKRKNKTVDLNTVTARLTQLLLPAAFNETYKHLIVIPCLNIGAVPFHLLKPYKDSSYLIDKCSFTIAPTLVDFVGLRYEILFNIKATDFDPTMSAETMDDLIQKRLVADTDSLYMTIDNALFVCNPAYPVTGRYVFPDLPGAEKEIAAAIPYSKKYTLLKGVQATKDTVLKYLNNADVAYFATHGVSGNVNADDSTFLVLSGNDPYLTSLEIKDLRFKSGFKMPDMVILSACQTGLGQTMEAGIMGSLSRAFLLGGSNHVVMSLWNVDDSATAYMMSRYIYHLQQPQPFTPSGPLRLAILDTKAMFPNPLQWAAFSLFGVDY